MVIKNFSIWLKAFMQFTQVSRYATIFSLLLLSACGVPEVEKSTLKVVNVLDVSLYQDAHISGSINVDFVELLEKTKDWDKKAPIVLYCSNYMCSASWQGAQELTKHGFENVMAYEGGIAEWCQLHELDTTYAVEGCMEQSYLKMAVDKPVDAPEGVRIITAQELKNMMQDAKLL